MGSFLVDTLWTGGCAYDCTISYDTPTRSGDKVKIKNVKATITSSSQYQTLNRIAVSLDINGVNKAYNKTILYAYDYDYPSSKEVTLIESDGYEFDCLENWFYISVTFKSTGYGDSWNSDYGHASTDDWKNPAWLSCPARTYAVAFDANGGSGAPSAQAKIYNTDLTISSTTPTYLGYEFKGWSGSDGIDYQPGSKYTTNAPLALTAVWQANQSDLDPVEDVTIGAVQTFEWTPQSASLTYKIVLSLGSWSWTSGEISPASTSKYTFTRQIPMEVCNQLPTQTEGLMRVDLETYSGSTKTGTSTQYFNVTVPSNVVPVIDMVMATPALVNPLVDYLQNYSKVSGEVDCSKAYSSEIVEAKMIVGEEVIEGTPEPDFFDPDAVVCEFISDVLTEAGTIPVAFSVTDARGRTATSTTSITVVEYEPPHLEDFSVEEYSDTTAIVKFTPFYSSVNGLNSATYTYSALQPISFVSGVPIEYSAPQQSLWITNFSATITLTDAITSVTETKKIRPGKGNRFILITQYQFYVGMDDEGWKVLCDCDGGINEDGTVWYEQSSGTGFAGIGLPTPLEPDTDYELFYTSNSSDDDTVAAIAFYYKEFSHPFKYVSKQIGLKSGSMFNVPTGANWGVLVLGIDSGSDEITSTEHREFTDIIIRKVDTEEGSLDWVVETGNMGLNSPLQKYISKVVIRMAFEGTMAVWVAYDGGAFSKVYEKTSATLRSYDIPINVKRCDHFRFRISGTGVAKIYSIGYNEETGSEIQ